MKYLIISLIIFIIVSLTITVIVEPTEVSYQNYSKTVCHGKTCINYLLNQMNNRTINITLKEQSEICANSQWFECEENNFNIIIQDT